MRRFKLLIPIVFSMMLISCTSNNDKTEEYMETLDIKQEHKAQNVNKKAEDSTEELSEGELYEERLNRLIMQKQAGLEFDDIVSIDFEGQKLTITGNKEFNRLEKFNEFFKDINIEDTIGDFKFQRLKVEENEPNWYFDEEKIRNEGELNRIFKREISKDNIKRLVIDYGSLKGVIRLNISKKQKESSIDVASEFKNIVKKEDKDIAYYIIIGENELYKGIVYDEKKENGYRAYINLEYYDADEWTASKALKLRGVLKEFFDKLNY